MVEPMDVAMDVHDACGHHQAIDFAGPGNGGRQSRWWWYCNKKPWRLWKQQNSWCLEYLLVDWGFNPLKEGLFQSNQGLFGFQVYIYLYIYIYIQYRYKIYLTGANRRERWTEQSPDPYQWTNQCNWLEQVVFFQKTHLKGFKQVIWKVISSHGLFTQHWQPTGLGKLHSKLSN